MEKSDKMGWIEKTGKGMPGLPPIRGTTSVAGVAPWCCVTMILTDNLEVSGSVIKSAALQAVSDFRFWSIKKPALMRVFCDQYLDWSILLVRIRGLEPPPGCPD